MTVYVPEEFTADEEDILRRYFTNLDGPVFALVNLPEVVKGALFARYSRSPKSLRRLFLDEFVGDLDVSGDATVDATIGLDRAEELYEKVFFEYGDDSVAQLGGAHIACEWTSNLLTKILQRPRIAAYLEQSTRYIPYTDRAGGVWRYLVPDELDGHPLRAQYVAALDAALAEAKAARQPVMLDFTAEWCISCKEMEHDTFPDASVIAALGPYMLLRSDVTANDKDDQALLQRFHSFGPPTIAFFDASGTERENYRLVGFVPPGEFSKHVTSLARL